LDRGELRRAGGGMSTWVGLQIARASNESQKIEDSSTSFAKWPDPYFPFQIVNQTFENREVVLDGYSYTGCRFINVTFVYNGTTPPQFNNNKFFGTVQFRSDNPAINGGVVILKGLGWIKEEIPLNFANPNNIVVPMVRVEESHDKAPH
jgi:hypothetical protein